MPRRTLVPTPRTTRWSTTQIPTYRDMAGVQQYISSLYLWDLWVFFIFRDFAISIMAGVGLLG
jgi:hypothetical protein